MAERDRPMIFDDTIFSEKALEWTAQTAGTEADKRRPLPGIGPVYVDVPAHMTVKVTPGWETVVHPPTETKKQFDPRATAQRIDAFVQSRILKLPKDGYGIQLDEGRVVPVAQWMSETEFDRAWDYSVPEIEGLTPEEMEARTKALKAAVHKERDAIVRRYTSQPEETPQLGQSTKVELFDDEFLTSPPEPEPIEEEIIDSEPERGAAININRIAYALSAIVEGINVVHRAEHVIEHPENLIRRYGRKKADHVIAGMRTNAEKALAERAAHIETLVGAKELHAAHFPEGLIKILRNDITIDIKNKLDRSGKEAAELRRTTVENYARLAEIESVSTISRSGDPSDSGGS